MTAAEYKSMYMNYVKVLSLTYDNSSNGYYKMYENMAQYFLWNPYAKGGEGDELWYAQLLLETPSQNYKNRVALIEKIKAAFEQGLNFTSDQDTCTDNDGNIYKYNSKTGKFELKK